MSASDTPEVELLALGTMTPVAITRSGAVRGTQSDATSTTGTRFTTLSFKGIPFAQAPINALRWKPPVREIAWEDERDATAHGPICSQNDMMLEAMMGASETVKSEDCLTLNVCTPGLTGKRPVMVWIHGGAFQFGSGSTPWYDGSQFVHNGDVVVVTLNYRLGPLGFLHLEDLFGSEFAGSGNLGVLDQIAALEWVQESIESFGGDASNVTIFGESAGGGSVSTLMGTPAARPGVLFHKVIAQSGAASWGLTRDQATANTQRIIDALGIQAGDVEALRNASVDAIVQASSVLGLETAGATLPFAPVIDGTVLPQSPLEAVREGSARGVALLTGTNLDEMTLFNLIDPALANIDEDGLVMRVSAKFEDAQTLVKQYRGERPDISLSDLWTVMSSDVVFRIPAIRLVEAHLAHGSAHMYLVTWPTPVFGGALKSCHAVEIPFVFNNLEQPGVPIFLGDGPERRDIADRMHAAWIRFAHVNDPGHATIPAWPAYDSDRRATMVIDTQWELQDDPYGSERVLWDTWAG